MTEYVLDDVVLSVLCEGFDHEFESAGRNWSKLWRRMLAKLVATELIRECAIGEKRCSTTTQIWRELSSPRLPERVRRCFRYIRDMAVPVKDLVKDSAVYRNMLECERKGLSFGDCSLYTLAKLRRDLVVVTADTKLAKAIEEAGGKVIHLMSDKLIPQVNELRKLVTELKRVLEK